MPGLDYVIADTHGRFDLLCKAVSECERHAGRLGGHLLVLGDFVDRGPQSRSIIELLMAGPSLPNWRWTVLQGNHEQIMLKGLRDPARYLGWWVGNGGGATLRSYGYEYGDEIRPLKVPAAHLAWLDGLPLTFEDEHRIFVHAGVPFDQPVVAAARDTLQWMLYPGDVAHADAEVYADEQHLSGKHIVHGHHQSASHPLLKPHRTNLDSFAWFTGNLAIGVFDPGLPGGPTEILWARGPAA